MYPQAALAFLAHGSMVVLGSQRIKEQFQNEVLR
jgi:hypothetical protein